MLPTTTTPAAFRATRIAGLDHLLRVIGPHGPCGYVRADGADAALDKLNTTYAQQQAERARLLRALQRSL